MSKAVTQTQAKISEHVIMKCKHSLKTNKLKYVFVILFSLQMIEMLLLSLKLSTDICAAIDNGF